MRISARYELYRVKTAFSYTQDKIYIIRYTIKNSTSVSEPLIFTKLQECTLPLQNRNATITKKLFLFIFFLLLV